MRVTVLDHDDCLAHSGGEWHPERANRIRAARAELAKLEDGIAFVAPEPASRAWMERVHAPAMLDRSEMLSAAGGGELDADTSANAATWRAATLAAGAAVEAARRAIEGERAFALVRPPGHHATPERAMGFCFVNNVAVAAAWALAEGGARRVAIVDHDVHHGNGTQDAFWARGDVLYVSIHESPLYPGTGWEDEAGEGAGKGATVNLPMPAGTGESEYATLLDEIVVPRVRAFAPDLLLASAGYDTHHRDPIGHFRLSSAFFHRIHRTLLGAAPRFAAVLEGGYDLEGLARGVHASVAAMAGLDAPSFQEETPRALPPHEARRVTSKLAEHLARAGAA